MKILVCISQVPDTTTKIAFNPDQKSILTTGVQFIINPNDEPALTRALELKEALGGTVTVAMVGKPDTEASIRKALAIGADDAIRINADPADALFVATQLSAVAKEGSFDLIFTGKESIDYNGSQVGGMLAALLGLPFISFSPKISIEGGKALLDRELDGGKEILEASLPLVISAQKGMAEPRIPNMRGIMSARTKPLKVVEPTQTILATEIVRFDLPPSKAACKMVSADEPEKLVDLLHQEAKII